MVATLSICMVTKNEKDHLEQCLLSVKGIANEIIVVDTGSTDDSPQIASEFGARVFFYKWGNDFSYARNFSLDKASGEWILVLDGDEELDRKGLQSIKEKISTQGTEAYLLSVKPSLANQRGLWALSPLQPRLFKKNISYRYRGFIHEQIMDSILDYNPSAVIETASNITIVHHGCAEGDPTGQQRLSRNIKLINRVLKRGGAEHLRSFFLGREFYRHYKYEEALDYFLQAYALNDHQAAFMSELVHSIITSLYMLGKNSEALAFVNDTLNTGADSIDLFLLKGFIQKDLGLYTQAYQSVKEALSHLPLPPYGDVTYYQSKYNFLYLLGGLSEYFADMDGALLYYYEALKNNPCLIDPLKRMIAILHPRKNPGYTVDCLSSVFDLSDNNLQVEMADIFYRERAYQLTIDCLKQLEVYGRMSENRRLLKGLSLMRVKKYSEAIEVFQNIIQDKKLYIKAQQYLLLYYWIVEDYHMALGCLREIKNAEDDPSVVYVLNLLTRSDASETSIIQGQSFKLAKEILGLIVELGDNNQVETSFSSLSPILGERPSYVLAELYYNYEKFALARGEFLSLIEKGDDYALVFYYLGKTYWMLGEMEAALQHLQHAINKGLDTPKIRREKARLHQELAIRTLREGMHHFPDGLRPDEIKRLEENLIELPWLETT